MAEDKLKQEALERQQSGFDTIADLTQAALALGVGAALFYRNGGYKALSKGLEKTRKFLRVAQNSITEKALLEEDDIYRKSKELYNELFKDQNSAWRRISKDVDERPIALRVDDHRTALGAISEAVRIAKDYGRIFNRQFNIDMVAIPTINFFKNQIAGNDAVFARNFERFVMSAVNYVDDYRKIASIANSHFTEKQLQSFNLQDVVDHMKSLASNKMMRRDYINAHASAIKQAQEKLLDLKSMAKHYGSIDAPTQTQAVLNKILGDRPVAFGDLFNPDGSLKSEFVDKLGHIPAVFRRNKTETGNKHFDDVLQLVKQHRDALLLKSKQQAEEFDKIFIDSTLRINSKGEIYSLGGLGELKDDFLNKFANTLPGKLLKVRDLYQIYKAPIFQHMEKGAFEPVVASLASGKQKILTEENYFRIYDKFYRITKNGLEYVQELDGLKPIGEYGALAKMTRQMFGSAAYRQSDSHLKNVFDIGLDGVLSEIEQRRTIFQKYKDENWIGNVLNRYLYPTFSEISEYEKKKAAGDLEYALKELEAVEQINLFLSKNVYGLSKEALVKLSKNAPKEVSSIFEDLLRYDDKQLLEMILMPASGSVRSPKSFYNQDLTLLLQSYIADPNKALQTISIRKDRIDFFGGKETLGFYDLLRIEYAKEAFAELGNAKGINAVIDLIENAQLSPRAKEETKKMAYWAIMQSVSGLTEKANYNLNNVNAIYDTIDIVREMLGIKATSAKNAGFVKDFRKTIENLASERLGILDTARVKNDAIVSEETISQYTHIKPGIGVIDLIKSINDETKFKAVGKDFLKQFVAGRHDPTHVTTYTFFPYFFLIRLSDELNKAAGLGFSNKSTGSTLDLIKAIMLKRALPIWAGLTYLDYINDTAKAITGTSLTGAMAQGAASVDLAFRRASDFTGLTEFLKSEKAANPFLQYWFGRDEFQDYEERKKYYESGYDPIRKSRYWNFLTVSEFRGGKIAYWRPNSLRMELADPKDAQLYDSYFEKWSHSIFPTPTNPFSPLIYLLDPYWLEEKHNEDRPYPLSGKLFEDNTLFGVALNNTIGEIIKPQIRMHEDRLGDDMVDVKTLIANINNAIKAKAQTSYYKLTGAGVTPVSFTAFDELLESQPEDTEGEGSPKTQQQIAATQGGAMAANAVGGSGVIEVEATQANSQTSQEVVDDEKLDEAISKAPYAMCVGGATTKKEKPLPFADDGGWEKVVTEFIKQDSPLSLIHAINENTIAKAKKVAAQRATDIAVQALPPGVSITTKTFMTPEENIWENEEKLSELAQTGYGEEMVREMTTTFKTISGIYGYGLNRMFGLGESRPHLADAGDMTSYSRAFWDENVGGLGGEVMEIVRRFIPEFKRRNIINPLMNTMPDWLPEKFRYGDPYAQIQEGEARLPGKGYEALNQLHPDDFGQYGAFDRFKILADIAPNSPEYKLWRSIAQKTVQDEDLRKEMREIRQRVAEQNKDHDFYNYQFIGRDIETKTVIVEEVLDNNRFKAVGDNTIYRLAGIKVKNDEEGNKVLEQYLKPGMEVTVAYDTNPYYRNAEDRYGSTVAAVFIDGENLAETLLKTYGKSGVVQKRKNEISAAATLPNYSPLHRAWGMVMEAVAHLDVPYFSDKFARIRTPLEAYKAEQFYGTPYQSWSAPLDTYLYPAIERATSSPTGVLVGALAHMLNNKIMNQASTPAWIRYGANAMLMLANRGAFIGGFIGQLIELEGGKGMYRGAKLGAYASYLGYVYNHLNKPVETTINFGLIGGYVAKRLFSAKAIGKGAAIGAAVGFAISEAMSLTDDYADRPYTPERIRRKWDLQEYFDKLTYIKFMGLYHEAARRALEEEDVDIEEIINKHEEYANAKKDAKREMESLKREVQKLPNSDLKDAIIKQLNQNLNILSNDTLMVEGGKWTQAALVYYKTAKSTIYGLDEHSSYEDIIRAIPKYERDFFIEFAKEKDPEKRAEILQYVSPYEAKALKLMWGERLEKEDEGLLDFFETHYLPGITWSGWRPDVDLSDIKVKTIYNEGMLIGDFGIYETQLMDENVIEAPYIDYDQPENTVFNAANLKTALNGYGLKNVDISIMPTERSGIEIALDLIRIADYKVSQIIGSVTRYL